MNRTPKTENELEKYLRMVAKLRNSSDFSAALEACEELLNEPATRAAGLRSRADIYADMRQLDMELADRQALINLGSEEPSDYFDFGIGLWRSDRLADAVSAFARSIELGETHDFHHYTNASRMHLVGLLIKLNRHEDALRQCLLIPEGYSSYLPEGMTAREQLMERLR